MVDCTVVDRLDDGRHDERAVEKDGSQGWHQNDSGHESGPQPVEKNGAPWGIRTSDLQIRSHAEGANQQKVSNRRFLLKSSRSTKKKDAREDASP